MPNEGARSILRNVFIYDLRHPTNRLGGLVLTPGITNSNLYDMIEVFLIIPASFFLQTDQGDILPRNAVALLPGNYYVVTDGDTILVNNETLVTRVMSPSTGTRVRDFRDEVRARDRRCVLTKVENSRIEAGIWSAFEAAYIFPLAREQYWNENNFGRWITHLPRRGGSINSVQNGLLLRRDLHTPFDFYEVSINPDDEYKIVCFQPDLWGIAGTSLDRRLLDDERRPADELLRWHFRQSVLANMRGAGEPIFEHDFPPGSDIMGDIREGLQAGERMEAELFGRLAAHMELNLEERGGD